MKRAFVLRNICIAASLFLFMGVAGAQAPDSQLEELQVSILTCGPGEDIYSLFGHTALRIKAGNQDIVYNWGTFNYGPPTTKGKIDFTKNFLLGQLPYQLGNTRYTYFLEDYNSLRRSVEEQVLVLSKEEKKKILEQLLINMQKENRTYKYDFYYDNCVTRPLDIIQDAVGGNVTYPKLNDLDITFRGLLHENLTRHPWTKFGMDIILGTQSDQIADVRGQMFLPAYFRDYLEGARTDTKALTQPPASILSFNEPKEKLSWWTPLHLFLVLLLIEVIGLFLYHISGDRGFLRYYDGHWFIALAISSIIFSFMWFCTDHTVCKNNWDMLWASPLAFAYFFKDGKAKTIGLWLLAISCTILIVGFNNLPQEFNLAVLAIALTTILKCLRLLGLSKWIDSLSKRPPAAVITMILCIAQLSAMSAQKINGITVVSPPSQFQSDPMLEVTQVNADWIALVPYGFSRPSNPEVIHGSNGQWWGERPEGIKASLELAKKNGLHVMIKPQVWIPGGWVGEFDFEKESDWLIWEKSYRAYVMTFVKLAEKYEVEMLCIGTEYRISVKKREAFWRSLIKEVRSIYKGKLTYSSNWDSYSKVPFWDELDYIGISAYFPLSDMDTPPTLLLTYRWNKYIKQLKKYSNRFNKKILFTEFGYLSVDGAAGKTWELEKEVKSLAINEQAQANGYDALFKSFWNEEFWAGGFLWKWFPEGRGHEGYPERDYTPQNKKAQLVLQEWYGK